MSWRDEKDDWEGDYGAIIRPYPSGIRLHFDYVSKTGKKSTRTVNVREFGETGFGVMLIGFCEVRQAKRTFLAERISNCRDADTGVAVLSISEYLGAQYRKSVDFVLDSVFSNFFQVLKILIYFFKADGRVTESERSLLLDFCQRVSKDDRLQDDHMRNLIAAVPTISNHGFKVEVGRLASQKTAQRFGLSELCKANINAKKSPAALELDSISYIEKRLSKSK